MIISLKTTSKDCCCKFILHHWLVQCNVIKCHTLQLINILWKPKVSAEVDVELFNNSFEKLLFLLKSQ